MKLYITRHGHTNYNELGLSNADPSVDVYLTKLGKQQAQQLAESLKDVELDVIIVSHLKRTRETADIINQYHHVPIRVDKRIGDNITGFEGRPVSEYFAARDAAPDKWAFKPAGAESRYDVRERVANFLDDLRKASYSTALVVAHQSVNRQITALLENLTGPEVEEFDLPQGNFKMFELH